MGGPSVVNFGVFSVMESLVADLAVVAAGELGVLDALARGARSRDDLAEAVGADPPSLSRLLRFLTTQGIVTETAPGVVSLDEAVASAVRASGGLRPGFELLRRVLLPSLAESAHSVRTGQPAFEHLVGVPVYEYISREPGHEATFGQFMRELRDIGGPITEAYDFAGVGTVVDVGGGVGWRTIEILQAHPEVHAILFDRPGTAGPARAALGEAGVADRTELVEGSFFEEIPRGGDCYLVSAVLANWDDTRALAILRNCREAMKGDGRLLIFEPVLPEGSDPHIGKMFDIVMLVILGGRIRTEAEFRRLLDQAGFELRGITSNSGAFSVVEAFPTA